MRVQVHGAVGATVRLHLGNRPALGAAGFLEKPAMSEATWTSWVGTIGSAGSITLVFQSTLPMRVGDRYLVVFQGSVFAGGEAILTNSGTRTHLAP